MNNRTLITAALVLGVAMISMCILPGMADADGDTPEVSYVATIGETGYASFEDALEAAMGTTATIELLTNASISTEAPNTPIVTVPENTKLTINLNGHIITSNTRLIKIDNGSNGVEITINAGQGGKIDVGTQRIIANICSSYTQNVNAKVTVNGGEYIGDYPFMLYNMDEFTISNAKITAPTSGIWLGNLGVQNLTMTNVIVEATGEGNVCGIYLGTVKTAALTNVNVVSGGTAIEVKSGNVTMDGCTLTAGAFDFCNGVVNHNGIGSGMAALNINNAYCTEAGTDGVTVNVRNSTLGFKDGVAGLPILIQNDTTKANKPIDVNITGKTLDDVGYLSQMAERMTFNGINLNSFKVIVTFTETDPDTGDDFSYDFTSYYATLDELLALSDEMDEEMYEDITSLIVESRFDLTLSQGTTRIVAPIEFQINQNTKLAIPANAIFQIDGALTVNGTVENNGSIDLNGAMGVAGNKARLTNAGELIVKGDLTVGSGAVAEVLTSVKARNNATISGIFQFGDDNSAKFDNITIGQGGLIMSKGSVEVSGQLVSGVLELTGNIEVVDDLNIGASNLKVTTGSTMIIPEDVELSSAEGGRITNQGNVSIYGACSSNITNTGRVDVIGDAEFTGGYVGDQNGLKEVPFKIKQLSRMTYEPGKAVRIVLQNIPAEATTTVTMSNAESCWLTLEEDGKTLTGTAPSRAEVYRVTVTSTLGSYTDTMQFDISVTAPTVEPEDEPVDKTAPTWMIALAIVLGAGVVAVLTKGRIW